MVAVIGANGAGKSTLLRTIAGLMAPRRGEIVFDGEQIAGAPAFTMVRRGIAMVPEGRRLFPSLSVEENLQIGGQAKSPGPWTLERIYALFPVLAERRHLPAPALSGGQQQMAAIARALMANPRLLLCDEISFGLAPIIVRDIYARLPEIVGEGISLDHRRAGHRAGAASGRPGLLPAGGPHRAAGQGRRIDARGYFGGVFRGVTSR